MRLFTISILFLFVACSDADTGQASVVFEEDTEDTSYYQQDTVNYLQSLQDSTLALPLQEQFYQKYISMYFDDEGYLIITLRQGGVHFFDPHDSLEVADVLKFKSFIEFRDTLPGNDLNGISLFSLEQKIDSLLRIAQ